MSYILSENKRALEEEGHLTEQILKENLNFDHNVITLNNLAAYTILNDLRWTESIKQLESTISLLEEAIAHYSQSYNSYALLAIIYLHFKEYRKAEENILLYNKTVRGKNRLKKVVIPVLNYIKGSYINIDYLFTNLTEKSSLKEKIYYNIGMHLLYIANEVTRLEEVLQKIPSDILTGTNLSKDYVCDIYEAADYYQFIGDNKMALHYYNQAINCENISLRVTDRSIITNYLYLVKSMNNKRLYNQACIRIFDKCLKNEQKISFDFSDLNEDKNYVLKIVTEHMDNMKELVDINVMFENFYAKKNYHYCMHHIEELENKILMYSCFFYFCPLHKKNY